MTTDEIVFVGFNSRVAALELATGQEVWRWKAGRGSGYVSLILEDQRLIAAVNGHIYCLDPRTGQELWHNPMTGFGYGVTSLATAQGGTSTAMLAKHSLERQRRAASS